jgi:hypothetical protein
MAESRVSTLRAILQPKLVRILGGGALCLGAYDAASSQFDLPKLSSVWGMSGSLLPWWGWFLILQSVFVYALFEYVRRPRESAGSAPGSLSDGDTLEAINVLIQDAEKRLGRLEHNHSNFRDTVAAAQHDVEQLKTKMDAVIEGVIADRALELVAELDAKIGQERPILMVPNEHSYLPNMLDEARRIIEGIAAWCRRMGWPYFDEYAKEVQQNDAQIRANAINCTLEPGEENTWQSGSHKQMWLVNLSQLRSMRRLVQTLKRELPAKAQLHSIKEVAHRTRDARVI